MAFSSGGDGGHDKVNATINIVPLVDVMLVLLIIFMVTAPLMAHKVKVELPQANLDERPDTAPPVPPLTVAIQANGNLFLNDNPVTMDLLDSTLAVEAQKTPQPAVNVRADSTTPYRTVNEVVNLAQSKGMRKVGFVSAREKN
ncbi:biopolymer transport protein ExbD [Luteimonas sp. J16]|jgi:biopolymer transport protein ExbD|uniref:ExbD/TolR family protein n=1 Tax=unclassified Luteimonas TaxID=2629088 RepID=UPI00047DDA9F|nr:MULTISPECIES: biopolymer transporter ExbD [unclassified Luteimonas]TWG89423.1 biopolymer transport protein ExbD [Luteimonas sp. J16]